jgi:pilus assembly protein CpaD
MCPIHVPVAKRGARRRAQFRASVRRAHFRGVAALAARFARQRGARVARLLVLVGCAALLSGCYTTTQLATPMAFDYRLRHPIAIKDGARTVELLIGSNRGGLTGDQRADVFAFANTWRREATGGVLIELPSGTRNEVAAANALHEVRSILSAAGIPPHAMQVRPYRPVDPSRLAALRLNYPTMTAEAGPCGQWPDDLGPTYDRQHNENMHYWNYGCATQRNLAALVENKADLIQPRGEVPPYTGRRTTVLDKYHRGEGTATVYPDANKGKISDVGQ